jgi:hypothetical protein
MELVVDGLFKICACVAVDGTKPPGRTAEKCPPPM